MYFFVPNDSPIHDPAGRAFVAHARALASHFSQEVHGRVLPSDVAYVQSAAQHLWQQRDAAACWGELDVDGWLAELAAHPAWQDQVEAAAVSLHAFYCYLVKHALVPRERALRPVDALQPYTSMAMCTLIATHGLCGDLPLSG